MKRYILGLFIAFVAWVAVQAATGDTTQATGVAQTAAPAPTGGATAAATAAPARSASDDGGWIGLAIWAAVIIAIFAFLWSKGYLVKIRNYFEETQEELKKCSWPSREELKGSTVVVLITTALLGLFTVGVDWLLSNLMRLIT